MWTHVFYASLRTTLCSRFEPACYARLAGGGSGAGSDSPVEQAKAPRGGLGRHEASACGRFKRNSSNHRPRVEQWPSLVIRTAIILLVVLAVAGPYFEQAATTFVAGRPTHKVFVIDGSYSMAYRATDKSRFDPIRLELATQIVDQSRQGDAFTLILMASPPKVIVGTPSQSPRDFFAGAAKPEAAAHWGRFVRHCGTSRRAARRGARAEPTGPARGLLPHRFGSNKLGNPPPLPQGRCGINSRWTLSIWPGCGW